MPAAPPVDYIERTKTLYSSLGHPPYQWVANSAALVTTYEGP